MLIGSEKCCAPQIVVRRIRARKSMRWSDQNFRSRYLVTVPNSQWATNTQLSFFLTSTLKYRFWAILVNKFARSFFQFSLSILYGCHVPTYPFEYSSIFTPFKQEFCLDFRPVKLNLTASKGFFKFLKYLNSPQC